MERRIRILSKIGEKVNSWLDRHDIIPDDKKGLGFDKPTYWYWLSLQKQAASITNRAYEGLPKEEELHYTDLVLTQMALVTRLAQSQKTPERVNIKAILEANQQSVDTLIEDYFGSDVRQGVLFRNVADLRAQSLLGEERWNSVAQTQALLKRPTPFKGRKKA